MARQAAPSATRAAAASRGTRPLCNPGSAQGSFTGPSVHAVHVILNTQYHSKREEKVHLQFTF